MTNLLIGDSSVSKSYLSQALIAALTTGTALNITSPFRACDEVAK